MIVLALAAALTVTSFQDTAPSPARQSADDPAAPVSLEDVEVTGRPLDSLIRNFVDEVAAPNRGRSLARWNDRICVGVANLRNEPAQYIADRVSTIAEDIGLTPGQPGCTPNIMIVASDDATTLAQTLVTERRRAFRLGGAGMDQGGVALRAFETSDKPVRWWQVALPADSETGQPATRMPGECRDPCDKPLDYAPIVSSIYASRLSTQIVDNLIRTIVILDVDQISGVSLVQLADYIAMITLAQIDPEADTSGYASILNVFDAPEAASTLTDWDTAYLQGLYDAERSRKNLNAGRMEIADSIHRAHANAQTDDAD